MTKFDARAIVPRASAATCIATVSAHNGLTATLGRAV
jgi:hypothetical protein